MSFGFPSVPAPGLYSSGAQARSSTSQTQVLSPHPVLRLRPPAEQAQSLPTAPQSLPTALDAMSVSALPSRESLLQETKALKTERHQVADALQKYDPDVPSPSLDMLRSKHQLLNKQIAIKEEIYQKHYGTKMMAVLQQWRDGADELLVKGHGIASHQIAALQGQLEAFVPELENFFNQHTQQLHAFISRQLTNARRLAHIKENSDRVRALIDSDHPIMANQLRPGDDQVLFSLFNQLDEELDNLVPMLTMDDIDDQQRHQAGEKIRVVTDKLDKIAHLFETVIHRYSRLKSDQQYPHQLARMKEVVRKGRRALDPSLTDQNRQRMIDNLKDPAINPDHLHNMSEEDFQLIYTLLSKKPLSRAHRETMSRNNWQLSEHQNLVTQRGHDTVMVVCRGNSYRLLDTATGIPIGTLDRTRWDRIQQQLAAQGLRGAQHISRQMIIEDFKNFPTTEEQLQARFAEFRGTLRQRDDSAGSMGCRPPSNQPALSEPLRYQRYQEADVHLAMYPLQFP